MKGLTVKEIGVLEWIEKDKPEFGPLDALVRPTLLSPCSSDIHSMNGGSGPILKDRIIGHEAVGEVLEIGSLVTRIKPGDIVAIPAATPDWLSPGVQMSMNNSHDHYRSGGFKFRTQQDGTMAEAVKVIQADANLALIPEGVSLEAALMSVDMMNTGFWGAEQADIKLGDTVVVIGIGPVGLMALAGAKLLGAGRIIAIDERPVCAGIAREYGANDIVSYKNDKLVEQILDMTGGGADSVILAGGNVKSFQQAIQMTRAMGKVSSIKFFDVKDRLCFDAPDWGLGMADKTIHGGFCPGGRVRVERLMALIKYGRIDPTKLITHRFYGLDKLPEACRLMEKKPQDLIKPVVYTDAD